MKRLIVNADDFGLHPAVNRGIIAGHKAGCITSTSLMPGANAFDHAVQLAQENPYLGVGVHLTLVGERSVADPIKVSSLVDNQGLFSHSYPEFLMKFLRGQVNLSEIRIEMAAQVEKVIAAGVKISHLDSHQHLHVFPGILGIVLDLAVEYRIKALRIPGESLLFVGRYPYTFGRIVGRSGLTGLATMARRKARKRNIAVPDHFFGMLAGGNMQEEYFLSILNQLPPGSSEIMVHPGDDNDSLHRLYVDWPNHWKEELETVTSSKVLGCIKEQRIELVSFRELDRKSVV